MSEHVPPEQQNPGAPGPSSAVAIEIPVDVLAQVIGESVENEEIGTLTKSMPVTGRGLVLILVGLKGLLSAFGQGGPYGCWSAALTALQAKYPQAAALPIAALIAATQPAFTAGGEMTLTLFNNYPEMRGLEGFRKLASEVVTIATAAAGFGTSLAVGKTTIGDDEPWKVILTFVGGFFVYQILETATLMVLLGAAIDRRIIRPGINKQTYIENALKEKIRSIMNMAAFLKVVGPDFVTFYTWPTINEPLQKLMDEANIQVFPEDIIRVALFFTLGATNHYLVHLTIDQIARMIGQSAELVDKLFSKFYHNASEERTSM